MSERTILVTGASGGIGRATARAFVDAGWRVGLIGRREDALREVAGASPSALVLPCDVTDPASVDRAFATAAGAWGRLDCLFNNAGVSLKSTLIDEMTVEQWQMVVNTNITGMFLCARAAFAQMRRQSPQGGRIINNGSISRPFGIACGQIDIGNALTDMTTTQTEGVPQADGSIRAEATMDVGVVARSVLYMAGLPPEANVQFMTVMATTMPYIGRG